MLTLKAHNHTSPSNITPPPILPYRRSPSPMDPSIWSRLPEEILEYVLSLLPLKTFFNLRSTCKRFKSLLFSPPFVSKYSSGSSPFASFLLLSHPHFYHNFPVYDSSGGTWRGLALSLSDLLPSTGYDSPSTCTLLSSSNGLFCFSRPTASSFVVCNSLTKSFKVIEFPVYPFGFESFAFVSTPFGYKIFVLYAKSSSNSVFVYDSKIESWHKFNGFEPILSDNYHQQEGVFLNGLLYFTTPEPFSIVSFDLESGEWNRLSNELPGQLTFLKLLSNGEKLYVIGGIGRNGISKLMKLWEMSSDGNWVEIESLPEMMCRKFVSVCYHNYEQVYCFWHEGMICVCCYTWPEILYYKVSRRTWHWLPKCPSLPEKWSCGFKWFPFVPALYVPV